MFTSWCDLEAKMKNDLAANSWHISSYTIRNRTTTYTSFDEFLKAYRYVAEMAAVERGEMHAGTARTSVKCR